MESISSLLEPQIVLAVAAIAVAILGTTFLLRTLKSNSGLVLAILVIVLFLQYGFHISPSQLWAKITHLPTDLAQVTQRLDLNTITSVFED